MSKIKTSSKAVVFNTGVTMLRCSVCRKEYQGYERADRHTKRTGHNGYTKRFKVTGRVKV